MDTVDGAPALTTQAGVIDDARQRQSRQRRLGGLWVLAGGAVIALIVVLAGGGGGGLRGGHGHGGEPLRITFADQQFSAADKPITIAFSPGPGGVGGIASFGYDGSQVVDQGVSGRGPRVLARWDSAPADRATPGRIMVAIVGRGVAAVRAARVGTFKARHVTGLPSGYKAVVFDYPKWPAALSLGTVRATLRYIRRVAELARLVPLVPLDAAGRPTGEASTTN